MPQVEISGFEDGEEGEQDPEKIPASLEELQRPWIKERDFQIEHQEEHCHQVELDGITLTSAAERLAKATLVWFNFGLGSLAHRVQKGICDHDSHGNDGPEQSQNREGKYYLEGSRLHGSKYSENWAFGIPQKTGFCGKNGNSEADFPPIREMTPKSTRSGRIMLSIA